MGVEVKATGDSKLNESPEFGKPAMLIYRLRIQVIFSVH